MQSVKFAMRDVGVEGNGRISSKEFEDYLEFNFLSNGYEVLASTPEPIYEDGKFMGVHVFVTLVKTEEDLPAAKAKK